MNKKDIAIVIPIYLSSLSEDEKRSIEQCLKLLSEYSIVVIKPKHLEIDDIIQKYKLSQVEVFPDECFSSLRAYNKTVLTEEFYTRFQNYTYMLIYQLDAYVFKDELLEWATKGYDYIGAPWLPYKKRYLTAFGRCNLFVQRLFCKLFTKQKLKKRLKYYAYHIGNGGFSLRRISKMIEVTRIYKKKIDFYMADDKPFYPEDLFLHLELSFNHRLYTPKFKEALQFSIEMNPEWGYHYNQNQLPFGCHAWSHKDYAPFWKSIIK